MRFRPMEMILGDAIRRRMIRTHNRWLSRAVKGRTPAPRIPRRRVDEGGFAHLMATDAGRNCAAAWWEHTLRQMD